LNHISNIKIELYKPEYADDFARLNKAWIQYYFDIEPTDIIMLGNPQKNIIDSGGQIFFAIDEAGIVVGCCALVYHTKLNDYELAKMAVAPSSQGRGIGNLLCNALIIYSVKHNIHHIYLEGNTTLEASIALYQKNGFFEAFNQTSKYKRCDIVMELLL
jgi:N-acetylglutamate synthase-like GNAT family acetyltransferase